MDTSKQARKGSHIILSLLGINKATSPPPRTKALRIADYLCLIAVCLTAGYLATLQGFDSLPINADSLAPFEEAKSLISNPNTHLFNIHVSRIASIFPDLTLNTLLQLLHPKAGFLEIFSQYAWCTSSLFLLLATLLTNEIQSRQTTLTADSIKISLVTVSLLNISHQFNIAYSHFITPVHHGGNVLNTLLLLFLSLHIIKKPKRTVTRLFFVALIVLATLSNKMSIFTAVFPAAILFLFYLKGKERRNQLISIVLAALAGVTIGSLFNEQCATPEFNLLGTFSAFRQYFQLSWITSASALFSIGSLLYVVKQKSSESDLSIQTRAGLVAISLSSLSYFIYLPMLTSSGEAPLRYICIAYALIVAFFVIYINRINKKFSAAILVAMIIATLISFQSDTRPRINLANHQSLKQELVDRSERVEPFKSDAAKFIQKMDYSSYLGLGDYWMSGTTLISNSKVQIIPIHQTGVPDFWGATPQDIREQIKPLKRDHAYVLTDNEGFNTKFAERYGPPTITWNYDHKTREFSRENIKTNFKLLVYENPEIYNKVRKKSKNFQRQCNPSLPNYSVR